MSISPDIRNQPVGQLLDALSLRSLHLLEFLMEQTLETGHISEEALSRSTAAARSDWTFDRVEEMIELLVRRGFVHRHPTLVA